MSASLLAFHASSSSRTFSDLDDYMWKFTYKWAKHSHPNKPRRWIVKRHFGKFNKFRNDKWVFGDRECGGLPAEILLDEHRPAPLVIGGASPDDPSQADYWAQRRKRVRTFLAWLEASGLDGDPLTDAHDRDFAIRDYKTHMKTVLRRASNTVNAHLTALDHFFTQLGLGPAVVRRDDAPKLSPRALDARQQKRYLRAVERRPLARDRAIGRLLFYSGVRIAELVALDDDDVPLSARKGKVIVRSGKGETSREIPLLDGTARTSITEWRTDRASWPGAGTPALFLNRRGGRLSARANDRYRRRLQDLSCAGRPVQVELEVRRFICDNSACPVVTFAEQVSGLTAKYQRRTVGLHNLLERVAPR
ncbi:tyrosine-type recombinase/integrase [Nonomuraea sp. NPDC005983]|uniref:tyrosine-type recombinase/integrase n=1 Tax=Nonomuraea sp. NPDC005983 TaxID=3155595 RepID=UPI0033B051E4